MNNNEPEQIRHSTLQSLRRLRACMRCHLIKSEQQWREQNECENCPFFQEKVIKVMEFTTQHFEGVCAITRPQDSWLSKYIGVSNFIPGVYCLRVKMMFSQDIVEQIQSTGYKIVPND